MSQPKWVSDSDGRYDDLTKLSDRQLYDLRLYGPDVATKERRAELVRLAQAESDRRRGTFSTPTAHGMGADGRQRGVVQITPAQIASAITPPAQTSPEESTVARVRRPHPIDPSLARVRTPPKESSVAPARTPPKESTPVVLIQRPTSGGQGEGKGVSILDIALLDALKNDSPQAPPIPRAPAPVPAQTSSGGSSVLMGMGAIAAGLLLL